MSTTLERSGNTPQPYENVGNVERSSSNVSSQQRTNLDQSQDKSQTNISQNQEQNTKHDSQDRPSPMSGRLGSAPSVAKSTGREQPQEEEKGAAKGEGEGEKAAPPEPEGGYPEQLHAGKLEGVGPEYGAVNKTTISDRFKGIKEQIKGKVKHDPEMQKRGKVRMTGELKKKQREQEDSADPFNTAKEDDSENSEKMKEDIKGEKESHKDDGTKDDDGQSQSQVQTDSNSGDKDLGQAQEAHTGTTDVPSSHPTEKGSEEQAASVKPEGTGERSKEEKAAKSTASNAEITSQS